MLKKRVLYVIDSLRPAGAEVLLCNVVERASKTGGVVPDVAVLYGGGALEGRLRSMGVSVHDLGFRGHWDLARGIRRVRRLVQERAPDLVHTHLFPAFYVASLAMRGGLARVPLVHTEHSAFNRRRRLPGARVVDRAVYDRFHRVVCVSDEVERNLLQWLPALGGRTTVIHNGVAVPEAAWSATSPKRWDVLAVARLAYPKGIDVLLEAVALHVRRGREGVRVAIAGDGPERESYLRLADRLGIGRNVTFLGQVADVEARLREARTFVLPSRWEGLSIALLEAMALGMPIVATRVSGSAQVLTDGETGLLADPENPRLLQAALAVALDDPARSAEMGAAARRRVRESYSIEAHLERTLSIYRSVA